MLALKFFFNSLIKLEMEMSQALWYNQQTWLYDLYGAVNYIVIYVS